MGKPKLYKVLAAGGECCNGGKGKWHLPTAQPGKWMPGIVGDIEPCSNGYHLCREKDLVHWLNGEIYEAEYRGDIVTADDKVVVRQARLVRRVDTWNERTARLFACDCAERALKYADKMSVGTLISTINTARKFANGEASQEDLAAAWDAARDAARAAAWDAETRWQTKRLFEYLNEKRK